MQKERMWKWPGESLLFYHRFFAARALARSPSDPLAVSLPHLQHFCLHGNTPWPGKVWPFFPEGHVLVLFSHCKCLPMEGSSPSDLITPWKADQACSRCQRESDLCPGGLPSTHLTQHWSSLTHVGAITRTSSPLIPRLIHSCDRPEGRTVTWLQVRLQELFFNLGGMHASLGLGGVAEEQERCLIWEVSWLLELF